jgi:hypothetical protein
MKDRVVRSRRDDHQRQKIRRIRRQLGEDIVQLAFALSAADGLRKREWPNPKFCDSDGIADPVKPEQKYLVQVTFQRATHVDGKQRSDGMNLGPWGDLMILAIVAEMVFATCVFVYISRLEQRTSHPLGEAVGAHKAVLAKLRKRDPMSRDELDYATELVADARSPLAYAIPAALFTIGFFYVVGCLFMLHLDGGNPSFRTFVGGIPMLTSMNMAAQLRRVARLKANLQQVSVTAPEPADELVTA